MRIVQGRDLWDFHANGEWIAIPTNGVTRSNGEAVMGAGLAKQAAERFPDLPQWLGAHIHQCGNVPHAFPSIRLLALPTKSHWRDKSDLQLIQHSMQTVRQLLAQHHIPQIYCPPLGCGLGGLQWYDVAQAIAPFVDDRFIFVLPAPACSTTSSPPLSTFTH